MPRPGSEMICRLAAIVTTVGNVGGATTSGYPRARAAAGSWYSASYAPMARANSRIFSRPTRYGSVGGQLRPTNDGSRGMASTYSAAAGGPVAAGAFRWGEGQR